MLLTYHEISLGVSSYPYSLTVVNFEQHLEVLKARLGLNHLVTFDDGHESQHRYALPLLEKHRIHGTFFITAGWVGRRSGYMRPAELRELVALSHEVEAHGWSHLFLTKCSAKQLEEELRRPKESLEQITGRGVKALSAPGGRWSRTVADACQSVGYERLYISNPWAAPKPLGGLNVIGRHMVRRDMSGDDLVRLLTAGSWARTVARARHQTKEGIKRLVGDSLYQYMWERAASRGQKRQPA